jgi:recombination protein U
MTRRASREAQRVGSSLEDLLTFTHRLYWNRHQVWVEHNGISGAFHINRGRRVFTPQSRRSAPDYYGCIDGKFIAFDAKTTKNKTRWRLHADYGHQFERLMRIHEAGGVGFFAVEQRVAGRLWLLRVVDGMSWPVLVFDDDSTPSVTPTVEQLYDWLPEVQKWLVLPPQLG